MQPWEEIKKEETEVVADETSTIYNLIEPQSYLDEYRCFSVKSHYTNTNYKYNISILDFKIKEDLNAPISLYAGIYSKTNTKIINEEKKESQDLFDKIYLTIPSQVGLAN
jgi:hypothetical protein